MSKNKGGIGTVGSNIGGQAIIEGVLMRTKDRVAIAIRKPNQKIKIKKLKIRSFQNKFFKLPLIRGIIALIETLIIGIKALNYSANENLEETEKKKQEKISPIYFIITALFSLILALVIFKFIPLLITQALTTKTLIKNKILFNIIEGLLKIIILFVYILIISRMKDIQRIFQYHGAEHKVVNCYENKLPLTLQNIKKFSTIHTRCGTSFIILVLIVSIIIYSFLPNDITFIQKLTYRILLLPLIAAISYEIIKIKKSNFLIRILTYPGTLLQKLTTKEPDEKQIEIAVKALNALKD